MEVTALKQVARYRIELDSKWASASAALMGAAFFLQALYFFALGGLQNSTGVRVALFLIFPMVMEVAWFILLRGTRRDDASMYGVLAIRVCLILLVQNLFLGSVVQIIFSIIGYLAAIALLMFICDGYLPYKVLGFAWFGLILLVRFLGFDIGRYLTPIDWTGLIFELPALCNIAAIMCIFPCMTRVKLVKKSPVSELK